MKYKDYFISLCWSCMHIPSRSFSEGSQLALAINMWKTEDTVFKTVKVLLTTLLLWLEFHYRMLGFLEKVLTDFALHGLPW